MIIRRAANLIAHEDMTDVLPMAPPPRRPPNTTMRSVEQSELAALQHELAQLRHEDWTIAEMHDRVDALIAEHERDLGLRFTYCLRPDTVAVVRGLMVHLRHLKELLHQRDHPPPVAPRPEGFGWRPPPAVNGRYDPNG